MLSRISMFLVRSIVLCLLIIVLEGDGNLSMSATDSVSYDTPLSPNDVRIGPHYIEFPLGRIFLIRKGNQYGAIKFINFWTGNKKYSEYATYDCWYQADGTGNLQNKNVKYESRKASSVLYGIGRFSFNFGSDYIKCGVFKLWWLGKGMVYFFGVDQEPRDYGIELAPTKWININEVNVLDPRIRWYKCDLARSREDIPVDKLW